MASFNNRPFNKAIRDIGLSINFGSRGGRSVRTNAEGDGPGFPRNRSRDNNMDNGGRWQRGGHYNRGGRSGFRGGRGRGYHPRSRLEDDEGDIDMNNERSNRNRSHPYGRNDGRRSGFRDRSPTHEFDPKAEYWKVLIPDGQKHSDKWLLQRLQTLCDDILTPINKHCHRDNFAFYVDNYAVANSLRKGSNKITTRDGSRLTIIVKPHKGPTQMTNQEDIPIEIETDAEKLDILKQFLANRYDANQIKLDLSFIYNDDILKRNGMERRLYDMKLMNTILKLIHDICPQLKILDVSNNRLKHLRTLDRLPTMCPDLEELDLSKNDFFYLSELAKFKSMKKLKRVFLKGNPACKDLPDQAVVHAEVRDRLPYIEEVDGVKLPPSIKVGLDVSCSLPPYKDNYMPNQEASNLIAQFLKNFFQIYDSEDVNDRQQLLQAYHKDATFSLTVDTAIFVQDKNAFSFKDILKKSRNLMKIRDRNLRLQTIKHKKLSVVAYIMELAKTKHELDTFSLDVNLISPSCLSFVVHGVFLDGETEIPRGFSRSFVAVPEGDNPFSIINDAIVIRFATETQLKKLDILKSDSESKSGSIQPAGNISHISPVVTRQAGTSGIGINSEQELLVKKFSSESKMNLKWSLDALVQNNWDFQKAALKFTELRSAGKIPPEAFE